MSTLFLWGKDDAPKPLLEIDKKHIENAVEKWKRDKLKKDPLLTNDKIGLALCSTPTDVEVELFMTVLRYVFQELETANEL